MAEPITRQPGAMPDSRQPVLASNHPPPGAMPKPRAPRAAAKKPKPAKPPRENHFVGVPVSRKVVAAMAAATGAPQRVVLQAIADRITPELLRGVHKELTEQTRLMADEMLEETLRLAFTEPTVGDTELTTDQLAELGRAMDARAEQGR